MIFLVINFGHGAGTNDSKNQRFFMVQLILGLFITVAGSAVGLVDKWKSKTEAGYLRSNRISIILLLIATAGGLITLFAGIDATSASTQSAKIAGERQKRIDSQNLLLYHSELANQNLIDKNLQYSRRLDSSTRLNYQLASKIARQATGLSDYLSGKGSFCYFNLGVRDPNTNNYHLALYSSGSNPMDDVTARIVNVFNIMTDGYGTVIHLGKVFPKIHTVRLFQAYAPTKGDSLWVNIFFQTNGREFVEELKGFHSNNQWKVHMEVTDEEGKVLLNKTEPGFPKAWLK